MGALFPVGSKVTITKKSPVPVAGDAGDHTGKKGRVRGYTDLAQADVIHVVDLDEPIFMPDGTDNPMGYGPNGPTGKKVHGDTLPDRKIDWLEVPGSCLS